MLICVRSLWHAFIFRDFFLFVHFVFLSTSAGFHSFRCSRTFFLINAGQDRNDSKQIAEQKRLQFYFAVECLTALKCGTIVHGQLGAISRNFETHMLSETG